MAVDESAARKKVTIRQLQRMKAQRERIVALGVYDAATAGLADAIGFHILMTGPSGPMTLLGRTNPAQVTFEEQLVLLKAVSRGGRTALINAHLPFLSCHASTGDAVRAAARLVAEGGADTVKCDGSRHQASSIEAIVKAGIPVIAHVGLQAARAVEQSGFGVRGRTAAEAKEILEDAAACVDAGAFALLAEHVAEEVMQLLASRFAVPAISLGSGPLGDGMCIVSGDAVGFSAVPRPAHAGQLVDVRPVIQDALLAYREQVRAGTYPTEAQAPHMPAVVLSELEERARPGRDKR